MKLYTEFEVRKAIELAQECEHECGGVYFDYTKKEIIDELTPIELPSDEEIEREARDENIYNNLQFRKGAKMVINKIQGGNK
jgi:hypothetical protein